MLILHISDIHFRSPDCLDPANDPEQPYRTALLNDVRTRAKNGAVDAIFVTGDIAFGGVPEEYAVAMAWLSNLAEAARCNLDKIFVVPGNHDVNRDVIKKSQATQSAQAFIAKANDIDSVCARQFRDAETSRALLAPLQAYNEFAKKFNCQVLPTSLCWRQDLELGNGIWLRIHGMTSTVLSGAIQSGGGQNDPRTFLYLPRSQTVLDPVPGFVNAVLCHHPPDWFLNQDEINTAVNGRAVVQFFGHKHQRRLIRDADYVRVSAGAVSPERDRPQWSPGYNLVEIKVARADTRKRIEFIITCLNWQENPDMFVPALDRSGQAVFIHSIPLSDDGSTSPTTDITLASAPVPPAIVAEVKVSTERSRNIIRRFWHLTVGQRFKIASSLGLIDPSTAADHSELELYEGIFRLAAERNLLDQLIDEVERMERA